VERHDLVIVALGDLRSFPPVHPAPGIEKGMLPVVP
jgi:hypothetical protein